MDKIKIARDAILADLASQYKAGERKNVRPMHPEDEDRWFKPQANYFSGQGSIKCPICNLGELRYSRASYNGHVHARCSNKTCVSWME
jgi:hypothetical protein